MSGADADVIIIGGGLAGLAAARTLDAAGVDWLLVDAADAPGGRVRTDHVDGFAIDRGFQVLLTAYPEAQRLLDYDALDLHAFLPGALVRVDGAFRPVSDPFRLPSKALGTVRAPIGSLADKLRVASLRRRVREEDPFSVPEQTTLEDLTALGFSERMIDRFFRPFLAGVLLDPELGTSNRMFRFVMKMFAEGDSVLPAGGIEAIPRQLAEHLDPDRLSWSTAVAAVTGREAALAQGGALYAARALLVATDGPGASVLLEDIADPGSRSTATLSFATERPPLSEPMLVLNGEASGPINHLCVPSQIAPGYAPEGAALVSASVVDDGGRDDHSLTRAVRAQLEDWFGPGVRSWRDLGVVRIRHAQPAQPPPALASRQRPVRLGGGRYVCGDHRDNASIDGALGSGRRAAETILADLAA